jgi:hypothetical protein
MQTLAPWGDSYTTITVTEIVHSGQVLVPQQEYTHDTAQVMCTMRTDCKQYPSYSLILIMHACSC